MARKDDVSSLIEAVEAMVYPGVGGRLGRVTIREHVCIPLVYPLARGVSHEDRTHF